MRNFPTRTAVAAAALLALTLGGCATGGGTSTSADAPETASKPRDKRAGVEARAQERWDLLIAGKAGEAYDYLSPGVRSRQTREQYQVTIMQRPVKWLAAKVNESSCEGDSCLVAVEVQYRAAIPSSGVPPMEMPAFLEERWLKVDGVWVHTPGR